MTEDVMSPGLLGMMTASAPPNGDKVPFVLTVVGPKEVAEYLHVPEQTVLEEAESGRLPGQKIGTQWRFLVLALAEWLSSPVAQSKPLSSKERMLSLAGAWRDDPTTDALVDEAYRQRKANPVGGK
jgi:excisionase family DNA binding protein